MGSGPTGRGRGLAVDRGWWSRVGCRGVDPELFFPDGEEHGARGLVQVAAAKAVCAGCPVVAPCLEFALRALPEGVAGGLSAPERAVVRAQRRRARGASPAGTGGRPAAVDGLVVADLVAGVEVRGARAGELAAAAVALHQAGRGGRWIGTWLGVAERRVYRWLARYRTGAPPVVRSGGGR
ncbi:MAG: WhiB family transcriptional regulator [Gemmatimonadales bacterium]